MATTLLTAVADHQQLDLHIEWTITSRHYDAMKELSLAADSVWQRRWLPTLFVNLSHLEFKHNRFPTI